jgi:integrase
MIGGVATGKIATAQPGTNGSYSNSVVTSFVSSKNVTQSTKPKAYLNWLLLRFRGIATKLEQRGLLAGKATNIANFLKVELFAYTILALYVYCLSQELCVSQNNFVMKKHLYFEIAFAGFIADSAAGRRNKFGGKSLGHRRLWQYRHVLGLIKQYKELSNAKLLIQLPVRNGTACVQSQIRYWQRFHRLFTRFLYTTRGYCDNTVAGIFRVIRSVFNYLVHSKGLPVGGYSQEFTVTAAQHHPVVLLPEQVHQLIYDQQWYNELPPHLKRVRNIAAVGCTTGLRFTDLMNLQRKHLHQAAGQYYLRLQAHKTNTELCLPLPSYCVEIMLHYSRQRGGYLLPRLSNTNLNLQLKKLGRAAGWTEPTPRYRHVRGRRKEVKHTNGQPYRFYEHITAHTLRRTAISTLLMLGVTEAVVRTISGHAPGSREFYRYVKLAQSYTNTQVWSAHERLRTNPTGYSKLGT